MTAGTMRYPGKWVIDRLRGSVLLVDHHAVRMAPARDYSGD